MHIDTSCDVAKLAITLAKGRVLEPERGANPFARSSLRTETSGTFIQKNAMRERPKRLAATRHNAFTYGMIPFRLPMRAQCG